MPKRMTKDDHHGFVVKHCTDEQQDRAKPSETVGDLNRRLKSDSRTCLPEALEYAASEGWIEVDGTDVTPGPSQPAENN